MRLDIAGDSIVESIGLLSGLLPSPLVHVTLGMGYARGIVAAVRLGLFDAIGDDEVDPAELARRMECDPDGTRALANALVGMDLLVRKRGLYRNARATRKWLLKTSERPLRDVVLFLGYCHEMLAGLEDGVRTGEVTRVHDTEHDAEFWDAYIGSLGAFAGIVGPEIARKMRLQGSPKRLLDVGGGHGMISAAICDRYDGLVAEVLDLPEAAAVGRRMIEQAGKADKVGFREGDMREVEWGDGWDAVLLSNVLHNATAEEGQDAIRRAFAALVPGGTLAICDARHKSSDGDIDMVSGWNELFFFMISGAQAWPEEVMRGWMQDAGFGPVRTSGLLTIPNVVLTARRPG